MIEVFLKMFGISVGFFVVRIFLRQNFVQTHTLTKILFAFLLIQLVQVMFVPYFFVNCVLIFINAAGIFLFYFFKIKILETRFRIEFHGVLSQIILHMKMGQSFRQSLRMSTSMSQAAMTEIMLQIYELVAFSPQKKSSQWAWGHVFLTEVVAELRKIDQTRHKSIEKVENYRKKLAILEKFRRRSGRIRGQIHLQLLLMTIIYVAVFAFNATMFPLERHLTILTASILLYMLGLLVVLLIGKRIRWTI